jgi:NADPH2:quinone reductase
MEFDDEGHGLLQEWRPRSFQWTNVDVPACGADQVLIKNEYISIEGGDLIAREVMPPERVPHIVGYQCAGEIVEVGADVQDRWVGQKVVTIVTSGSHSAWGSHAEFTATAANMTWIIPGALSVDIAAAIPVTFGTAHECLFEFGHLRESQSVLIHAGAGALGLATLQLAKRARARVFTTASDDAKLARLKADSGADVTINYVKQDFVEAIKAETGGKGVDLVVDSIAGSNLTRSIASLKYRGRAIMVGVSGRDPERLDPLALWANSTDVQGVHYPGIFPQEHDRCVAGLIDAVANGQLKVLIDRVSPLAEAAQAHRYILERKAFGRVLLRS